MNRAFFTAVQLLSAGLLALTSSSQAAPLLEKQSLFNAGTEGYFVYRIPGLVVSNRGTVLATVEARRGRGGDWDDNDVLLRRSPDGGRTWESPRLIVANKTYGPGPVSNFVMLNDRSSGTVHALFCHGYRRLFHIHSEDDGVTFSEPVEITAALAAFQRDYPWKVVATGPGHGTQLRNGRFVVPIWMSDGSGKEFGQGKLGHRPSIVSLIYSDDHGRTWQRGAIVCRTDEHLRNPSETVMVELADGRVLFNIRSESPENRRLISLSPDGIGGWSAPRFDQALLEPVCMASLIRLSWPEKGQPSRILFVNPDNLENALVRPGGNLAHDRKRLTVKMSCDECQTWPVSKVLEEGPSGYSDLAVLSDGSVLCFYECGMVGGMTATKNVTLARFNPEWLSAGPKSVPPGEARSDADRTPKRSSPLSSARTVTPNYVGQLSAKIEPTRRVVYKTIGDRALSLDLFEPAGLQAGDRRPCFVAIHGGGWTRGEPRSMYWFAAHCAELGMVGISVQYRLYKPDTDATVFECVKDARSALRYVRAHAAELRIDPQKIVANGASAGGHLAAATALFNGVDETGEDTSVSCVPNALLLFSPVIDCSTEGYGNAKVGARWRELSPAHCVRPGLPPTIVFHGTGDTTTPFAGAQAFHDAMLRAGNRSELVAIAGAQHTYMFKDPALHADTVRRMDAFLTSLGFLPAGSNEKPSPALKSDSRGTP